MKKQMLLALPLVLSPVFGEEDAGSAQKDKYCGIEVDAGVSCQYTNSDWFSERIFSSDPNNAGMYAHNFERFGHTRGTKFGGVLGAGYRAFIGGNVLAGLGFNVDLTGNKSSTTDLTSVDMDINHGADTNFGTFKLKTRGVVPTVYASLGYYLCAIDTVVGLKGGLTYLYSELSSVNAGDDTIKNKGITPVIGLFVEKNVYGKFNLRAEFDYRFALSEYRGCHTLRSKDANAAAGVPFADRYHRADVRSKQCGYSVRLVAAYNF